MHTTMRKSSSFLMCITCLCMLGSQKSNGTRGNPLTDLTVRPNNNFLFLIRKASGLEKQLEIVYKIQLIKLTKGYINY